MERTHQEFMSCEERLKIAGGGKAGGPLSQFEREVSCFELSSPQTALSLIELCTSLRFPALKSHYSPSLSSHLCRTHESLMRHSPSLSLYLLLNVNGVARGGGEERWPDKGIQ